MVLSRFSKFFLIFMSVLLQSCTLALPTGPDFSEEIDNQTRIILGKLLSKDIETLEPFLVPEFVELEDYPGFMNEIFDILPDNSPNDIHTYFTEKRFGNPNTRNAFPIYMTAYELEKDNNWVLVQLYVQELGGEILLRHVHIDTFEYRPSKRNEFNFSEKGLKHLLFFGLLVSVVTFILFSLFALIRDREMKPSSKALWFIFIIFGYWGLKMNWTTGEIANNFFEYGQGRFELSLIDFKLFGAGLTRLGLFEPWVMDVGIPLGAMVYWISRKRRAKVNK